MSAFFFYVTLMIYIEVKNRQSGGPRDCRRYFRVCFVIVKYWILT